MTVATLLPALDRFLEAATTAAKWRVLRPVEKRLKRRISRAFVQQGARLVARARPGADWIAVFNGITQLTLPLFVDPIQDAARAALTAGANRLIAELSLDVAFNLKNPRAVAYLEEHGAALVSNINSTTRDSLRVLLRQGVEEGWSYTRTADAIKAQFQGFAGLKPQAHIVDRATLVAVTEAGQAFEHGNAIVVADLQDAGLKMQKAWLTVGDDKVSDGCQENERAGWIPFDEDFPSGHATPLRFPGCRCTTKFRRAPTPATG